MLSQGLEFDGCLVGFPGGRGRASLGTKSVAVDALCPLALLFSFRVALGLHAKEWEGQVHRGHCPRPAPWARAGEVAGN